MIRFFGDNRPLVLLFLPLILLAFHVSYHLSNAAHGPLDIDFGFWGNLTVKQGNSIVFYEIIAASWVLFNAILLNYTYNSGEFNDKNTYLPSLIYIVLCATSMNFYAFNGLHLTNTALIITIYQIISLTQNQDGSKHIFNGGLFLGIAGTIYPPLLLLFPFGIIMYLGFRPFLLREFWFYLLGYALPFIYLISQVYIFDKEMPKLSFGWNEFMLNFHLKHAINTAIFMVVFFVGIMGAWQKFSMGGNRLKKELQLVNTFSLGLLLSLVFCIFLLTPPINLELFAIPFSLLFTYPFLSKRFTFASSLLFYLFLLFGLLKFVLLNQLS
jgi:hypothetical protein